MRRDGRSARHVAKLSHVTRTDSAQLLEHLYRDTITALHPGRAVRDALDRTFTLDTTLGGALHIIALGKAAAPMASAALEWCVAQHFSVKGGVCVTHDEPANGLAPLHVCIGDHPTPSTRSAAAAAALGGYIASHVDQGDRVLVLLSGGTSSLIGAPLDGSDHAEYLATTRALVASGLDINQINAQRRQLSRWGGGRLGAALQARGATVTVLLISDVIGDDLASIGSGPCIPERGDTAQPITHHVIADNHVARDTVVRLARERGMIAQAIDEPLLGDVDCCAERIALVLLTHASAARHGSVRHKPRLICWGGEPTVPVPIDAPPGGRMQALALTVARRLHDAGDAAIRLTLLAAGTDGRDGATNAAGAIVDSRTWAAIRDLARSPERDLATMRSHDALAAVGALIPAFTSGTNVNDLVIGLVLGDDF